MEITDEKLCTGLPVEFVNFMKYVKKLEFEQNPDYKYLKGLFISILTTYDMKRNIQLPYELFVALIKFHLFQDDDYADEIATGLEQKLDALVRHELYAKYKTAPTEEEREKARQEYLDERGVRESFRW